MAVAGDGSQRLASNGKQRWCLDVDRSWPTTVVADCGWNFSYKLKRLTIEHSKFIFSKSRLSVIPNQLIYKLIFSKYI